MESLDKTVLSIRDNLTQFRYDLIRYIKNISAAKGYSFFLKMLPMLRFGNYKKAPGFTNEKKEIYLNIPHKIIKTKKKKWYFVYCHECLHQMFNTYRVADQIKKEENLIYNHDVLNVASDCVINSMLNSAFKLPYPSDRLISPEYIKKHFDIEYDKRTDTQFKLYVKLIAKIKDILDDPLVQQMREGAPEVDAEESGGGQQAKTKKIPTTDEWKRGSREARKAANDILEKLNKSMGKSKDKKLSKKEAVDMLKRAIPKIKALKKQIGAAIIDSFIMNAEEFIKIYEQEEEIGEGYKTYDEGWKYAIDDVLNQIDQMIEQLENPNSGGGQGDGPGMIQVVPENDPMEESPFLPQLKQNSSDFGEGGGGSDDSDEDDISDMTADEAAESAKSDAQKAQKDASEAGQKANEKRQKANDSGSKSDSDEADAAEQNAKDAKAAAKEAQDAAGKAQEAAKNGDVETARREAKNARNAAKRAHDKNSDAHGQDEVEWNPDNRETEASNKKWGELCAEIKTYIKNNIEEMSKEDAIEIIKRFANDPDPSIRDFVRKCRVSEQGTNAAEQGRHIQTTESWASSFSRIIKNTIMQNVGDPTDYEDSYARYNRRQGFIEFGKEFLKPGQIPVYEKKIITVAFYVDSSGSMDSNGNVMLENIFKFIYSLSDTIRRTYIRSTAVKDCVFDIYAFNNGMREIERPHIPMAAGGTDALHVVLDNIIQRTPDAMINVVITGAEMNFDIGDIKSRLEQLPGTVIFITNNSTASSTLKPLDDTTDDIWGRKPKFKIIQAPADFNISADDFNKMWL